MAAFKEEFKLNLFIGPEHVCGTGLQAFLYLSLTVFDSRRDLGSTPKFRSAFPVVLWVNDLINCELVS